MKAVRVEKFGGLEALKIVDIPLADPGEGEARLKIEVIGVNFLDIYQRIGRYQGSLPFTLGQEAAGVVDAVGPNVKDVQVGDHVVYASVQGSYGEYAIVPAWRLIRIPENVDASEAVAVMLQGITAHYLAFSTYPLQEGETALIHAAGGGTGQLLVQVAKHCGARVIGTVSNEEKAAIAREAGANDVILYTQTDFESEVKRLTNNAGVDVVYDSVGKDTFDQSLNCLKRRGMMVLYGASSGAVPSIDPQVLNAKGSLYLTRPYLGHYTADRGELLGRVNAVFNWLATGILKVRIDKTFPLTEVAEAHRYLEGRQSKGKVLLVP
ncbi:MAG TPA: quinone oxidoreductase [Anaerolineales bacterium]|jgi:NADPH2:quinone reductase|nr:quinone oxidoreductase [Anaerolineales bacterium]